MSILQYVRLEKKVKDLSRIMVDVIVLCFETDSNGALDAIKHVMSLSQPQESTIEPCLS